MTGYDYEYSVASYLRRNGFYDVHVTRASGDYGVDVIARKGFRKYAVQCKYYSYPVGPSAVQEVTAGKAMYGCDAAMVVTNNRFTSAAENLARANDVILVPRVSANGFGLPYGLFSKLFWLLHIGLSWAFLTVWYNTCKKSPSFSAYISILFILAIITYPVWLPKLLGRLFGILGERAKVVYSKLSFKLSQWKKNHPLRPGNSSIIEEENAPSSFRQTKEHEHDLDISPITGLPCKFTINGSRFNLDNVADIKRFPMFSSAFHINGQTYYLNDYFRLCAQRYKDAGYEEHALALMSKIAEFEHHQL